MQPERETLFGPPVELDSGVYTPHLKDVGGQQSSPMVGWKSPAQESSKPGSNTVLLFLTPNALAAAKPGPAPEGQPSNRAVK